MVLSIKSFLFLFVPSFLGFLAKMIRILLVSYPLFLKISYLSTYIYFLNFKFKTIFPFIVFFFLKSQIPKKERKLVLPLLCFLSNLMSLFSSSDLISKFSLNSHYLLHFFFFLWLTYLCSWEKEERNSSSQFQTKRRLYLGLQLWTVITFDSCIEMTIIIYQIEVLFDT